MSIKIDYKQVENKDQAFDAFKENVTPEAIEKYQVKADFDYRKDQNKIQAKGKGFDFTVEFKEDHAALDLNLSFLLKPLKGKILDSLERQITRIL